MASHWHDEYEFVFVLKGSVEFTIYTGGKTSTKHRLMEGDGIFIHSGYLHSAKAVSSNTISAGFVFSNAFFNIKPFETVMLDLVQPLKESHISHVEFRKNDSLASSILSTMNTLCHIPVDEARYEHL